ncbi:MAG: hypothetical protein K9J28_04515, partial [Sulfuritalea sp.]|nr:hypothetical protein [Sulfuritalea sp.]
TIKKGNRVMDILITDPAGHVTKRYLWSNCAHRVFLVEDEKHNEIASGYLDKNASEMPQTVGRVMCEIKSDN